MPAPAITEQHVERRAERIVDRTVDATELGDGHARTALPAVAPERREQTVEQAGAHRRRILRERVRETHASRARVHAGEDAVADERPRHHLVEAVREHRVP